MIMTVMRFFHSPEVNPEPEHWLYRFYTHYNSPYDQLTVLPPGVMDASLGAGNVLVNCVLGKSELVANLLPVVARTEQSKNGLLLRCQVQPTALLSAIGGSAHR